MTSRKQLLFAYGLAVHLLIVGIVCYAAFSVKAPKEPIRFMYKTAAGKVLFDHGKHCNIPGYGSSCIDCHHHPSDDDVSPPNVVSCNVCHSTQPENTSNQNSSCLSCHELEDIESIEVVSHVDAFHSQCIQCHKEIETGPKECSQCHVL